MKSLQKIIKTEKHYLFIGLMNKFQGFGFLLSTNEPYIYDYYIEIEIRILWIRVWYSYGFNKT